MLQGLTEDQGRSDWGRGRHLVNYNDCMRVICLILILSISTVLLTVPMMSTSLGKVGCEHFHVAKVRDGCLPGLCSVRWRNTHGRMEVVFPLEIHSYLPQTLLVKVRPVGKQFDYMCREP